jgi:hypothetical protein
MENRMNKLELAAAIATIGAFILAGWQYSGTRQRIRTERERLVLQRERLRSIAVAATAAADTADYLVQRSKEDSAPREELTSVARVMRGQLSLVVEQLNQEERLVVGWRPGHLIDSRRPLAAPEATSASPALTPQ